MEGLGTRGNITKSDYPVACYDFNPKGSFPFIYETAYPAVKRQAFPVGDPFGPDFYQLYTKVSDRLS